MAKSFREKTERLLEKIRRTMNPAVKDRNIIHHLKNHKTTVMVVAMSLFLLSLGIVSTAHAGYSLISSIHLWSFATTVLWKWIIGIVLALTLYWLIRKWYRYNKNRTEPVKIKWKSILWIGTLIGAAAIVYFVVIPWHTNRKIAETNARIVARVRADNARAAALASLDSAVFVPPIDRTCKQKKHPLDTVFVVRVVPIERSPTIIVPEYCKIETAKTDNPRLVYIRESKEHLTDLKTRIDTVIPGQLVTVPVTRAMWLRGYRTPGVVQIHIFPIGS